MYILLLAMTLVGGLLAARRFVEPACPECHAKSWTDHPPRLECARCGWTNVAVVTVGVSGERRALQYEMRLEADWAS